MSCHVTSFKMFLRQTPEHIQGDEGMAGLLQFLEHSVHPSLRIYFCFGINKMTFFICLCVSPTLSDCAVH